MKQRITQTNGCFAQTDEYLRPTLVGDRKGNTMAIEKRKRTVRHVALAYPIAVPWMAMFVRGVTDYAQRHGGWTFTSSPPSLSWAAEEALTLQSLKGWPGDGVIAAVATAADAQAARRLGKPIVNVAAGMEDVGLPRVMPDHYGMGRLAAEHLLERGLRRLAYFGIEGLWYSRQRRLGFEAAAQKAGVRCDVLELPKSSPSCRTWQQRLLPLTRWLEKLKPPVGLLAVQDYRARRVVDECQRMGMEVPHEVAVIGMDDDPVVCEFCRPTLTSVSRSPWRCGYETAALLDRLMDGKSAPPCNMLIPSEGVIARQSTDTVAVDDIHVAAAVHYIHDHLAEPFDVESVVQATTISRRQLEQHFRHVLGCTLYAYISRQRCERAKLLLTGKDRVKFRTVAKACGFSSIERMRLVFKRTLGLTPQEYRQSKSRKGS